MRFIAVCVPGRSPGLWARGPSPPGLDHAAEHLTTAELFWVTKHGIKMTGMPAWGVTHDDEALWPVVAFVRNLPDMDAARCQDMLAQAKARHIGHHGPGEGGTSSTHPGFRSRVRRRRAMACGQRERG
jgi:hypothetical protein